MFGRLRPAVGHTGPGCGWSGGSSSPLAGWLLGTGVVAQDENWCAGMGWRPPTRWAKNGALQHASLGGTDCLYLEDRCGSWILFAGENGRTRHVSIPASLVQLLVPFLSYCRGSDPHGGSSVAGWLATSTRCLFNAAVALRRKHDRSDLPPDPPAHPPALNSGTQPRSCAPTCSKMTQAVVRRRGTSQATGFPGVEQRPRSRRPRSHLPACK